MKQRGFAVIEVAVGLMIIVIIGIVAYTLFKTSNNSSIEVPQDSNMSENSHLTPQPTDAPGTIVAQAKDGIITNFGKYGEGMTYLAETSRGFEAYLAVEEAQVKIPFTSENSGTYELWIYTSDDRTFQDGDRNVTIFVNESSKLLYQHKSTDTQGMVWQKVGVTTILKGDNIITVTKEKSSYAAFSFTSIKLTPFNK